MAEDYIVPLGIDSQNFTSGLDGMLGTLDKVEKKANDTGKGIEEAFGKSSKAADTLENSLKPTTKSMEDLVAISKTAKDTLGQTFDVRKEAGEFSKQVDALRKKLSTVTERKKVGLEVDPKAIKDLENATNYIKDNFESMQRTFAGASEELETNIQNTSREIRILNDDLKEMEAALKTLAPGTNKAELEAEFSAATQALREEMAALDDYQAQLKEVETANKNLADTVSKSNAAIDAAREHVVDLGSSFDQVYGDVQPLTTRLGELEDRMYEMALAGQQNTQEFKDLQREAIRYRQTIQQVDAAVDTFAKRSAVLDIAVEAAQGLTGAFAAAQGAAALMGEENEEVAEALLKVNAAMSLLQGVQAVAAVMNKESAISALLFRNNLIGQRTATEGLTVATQKQTIAQRAGTMATRAFGVALKAIGIGLIISLVAILVENWDKLVAGFNKILPAGQSVGKMFDRVKSIVIGVGNAVLQYLITPFKAITALLSGNLDEFKQAIQNGFSFKKNFTEGFNRQEERNEKAHQLELEKIRIEADARDLQRRKNRGEDVTREEIALQRRRVAIQEAGSKDYKEQLTALEDMEDSHIKEVNDKQTEAIKEQNKKAEEAHKKRLEMQKAANEQIMQYTRALQDAMIAAIEDEGERERAAINTEYARRIEDLRANQALSVEARRQQTELEAALLQERNRRLEELEKENTRAQLELQLEARAMLADLSVESMARDLELLEIDHQERKFAIEEQYKDESELRARLLASLTEDTERQRNAIQRQWGDKNLKDEEERQLIAIELAAGYAVKNERAERQKQIAILETKIEFAEKTVRALIASGEAENSLVVMQAKQVVNNLKKELGQAVKENDGQGFDFLDFIGLGDLGDEERDAVTAAGKKIGESVKQITDFMVSQYDRQIKKRQEAIDQAEKEIKEIEKRLETERKMREDGFANNVELLEAELAAKKNQQAEETRLQEEAVKKREQIQKAQLAADTAAQLVNMVTASTNIFKALSGIPFVGIPLAIATIATMFGAFTTAKIKAAQSIKQGSEQYGDGGWIDGKSHAEGGKKYYSPTGQVRELEKDEFVVKKKVATKHRRFLDAFNNERLSSLDVNDEGLRAMLSSMGISFMDDNIKSGLKEARDLGGMKFNVNMNYAGGERELKEMNENIKFLAQAERERPVSWEDDKYIYKKQGNRTTKILKKPKDE